ncbi:MULTISPECIES: ABC transporter permease [Pelosinus]|uniref:ABC-type transporter, integral membrane subunit n=1 Tax=Pelosinus fermentans B4 TaxID=1149862 RepID=I9AY49_9FIRM|nr:MULTISPECIES: ABC transporter permease [Pelosinus]EIW17797.1 ABC-type transporter, integral membrane subunit [Pelosinus fermentans B4]EIW23759.1 ABC-type transporter, integral membrane subunit [Pelosinus fermentans A11]OAM94682.1 ABC-type transporter, integral membrane subunit [Pelosinus fermentans DSM 17108]SDR15296.1 monosaccharide ABC transporter membrane protein, CUT2 family [Pelosinus fermentans]
MMEKIQSTWNRFTSSRLCWPLAALIIVLLFNFFFTKDFFAIEMKDGHFYGVTIDILNRAAPLMLLAIGMTLVIATKGIDISVGSMIAISGAVAASLIGGELEYVDGVKTLVTLVPMPVAIFTALLVTTLLGMWNGLLISKVGIQPIVATLILLVAGRGIAQLITQGQIITVYYKPFQFIGTGYILGLPFSLFLVGLVFGITFYAVRKTALGLFIESIGINAVASRFAGINVSKYIFSVYAFSGLCAGLAGLIICSNVSSADGNNAGLFIELDAILAVSLGGNSLDGGRFSLVGSLIGALVIQSITTTIYALGVPPEITLVVKSVVVIIICLLQSANFRKIVFSKWTQKRGIPGEKNAAKL